MNCIAEPGRLLACSSLFSTLPSTEEEQEEQLPKVLSTKSPSQQPVSTCSNAVSLHSLPNTGVHITIKLDDPAIYSHQKRFHILQLKSDSKKLASNKEPPKKNYFQENTPRNNCVRSEEYILSQFKECFRKRVIKM